jgi:hypothetical protein
MSATGRVLRLTRSLHESVALIERSEIRVRAQPDGAFPDYASLHPGLYEVVVVKGVDSLGHGFALAFFRGAMRSRWPFVPMDSRCAGRSTVKAGRRPPPEAARSGLDGGEAGAKLSDRDVSRRAIDSLT